MADWPPKKNAAFEVQFPIYDADGDLVTAASTPDSEVSKDHGTFTDCTNEATEIATSSGVYYLSLTATEMNADIVATITKTITAGAKTAVNVMYTATRQLVDLAYPATSGRSMDVDALGGVEVGSFQVGAIGAAAFAAGAIDAAAIATGAIDADALAADAVTEIRSLASGTSDSGSTTTMVDAARTEADTDYWKGCFILFTSGTIAGQVRLITAFTPATDTITFTPATTQAVATQTYEILPAGAVDLRLWLGSAPNALISGRVDANVQALANDVIAAAAIATGAIDADAIAADAITAAKIANGAIDAATFAAGAIDAAAIAADAIGSSEFAQAAADKVWSSATRNLTALGFILGAPDIGTGAIDADALAADAVTEIRSLVSGTADSGSTTTMVDAARTEADVDYWKGCRILFTSGTISGQVRLITAFDPATDTVTFAPATTQAVSTQTYEILPAARVDLQLWLGAVVNALQSGRVDGYIGALAAAVIGAAAFAANAVDANALAADAVNEIADGIMTRASSNWEAAAPVKSLGTAVMKAVHRIRDNAGSLEVYRSNGTTVHATQTVTTDVALNPIDELTGAA